MWRRIDRSIRQYRGPMPALAIWEWADEFEGVPDGLIGVVETFRFMEVKTYKQRKAELRMKYGRT